MQWTKYRRNAVPGETVFFYPGGNLKDKPIVAQVTEASGVCVELSLLKVRISRMACLSSVRHVNDPHWDQFPAQKQKDGAWDFHPVFGGLVNGQLDRLEGARKRAQQLEQQREEMSADEYEALKSLEAHGPVMSRITESTGLSVSRLNALPKFNEAFKAAKLAKWEEKNSTSVDTDDDVDDEDVPGGDVEFCKSQKQAVKLFGLSDAEWDEMKSRDGFPEYQFGKGWPMDEVRAWMAANMSASC